MAKTAKKVSARKDQVAYNLVSPDKLTPSGFNPRKYFDGDYLQELAESLKQHGMLEPIVVRLIQDPGLRALGKLAKHETVQVGRNGLSSYEIICGECRWKAAKLAGLELVPVRILEDVNDQDARVLALVENLKRRDINPMEEAEGYRALLESGMAQVQIADAVHRSPEAISNALRLLKLPDGVKEAISNGKVSQSHGKALLKYAETPALMEAMTEKALAGEPLSRIEKPERHTLYDLVNKDKARTWNHDQKPFLKCLDGCNKCRMPSGGDTQRFCLDCECFDTIARELVDTALGKLRAKYHLGTVKIVDGGNYWASGNNYLTPSGFKVGCQGCQEIFAVRRVGEVRLACGNSKCFNKTYFGISNAKSPEDVRRKLRKQRAQARLTEALSLLQPEPTQAASRKAAALVLNRTFDVLKADSRRAILKAHPDISSDGVAPTLDQLVGMNPLKLLVVLAEGLLREDATMLAEGWSVGRLAWFLGEDPDELKGEVVNDEELKGKPDDTGVSDIGDIGDIEADDPSDPAEAPTRRLEKDRSVSRIVYASAEEGVEALKTERDILSPPEAPTQKLQPTTYTDMQSNNYFTSQGIGGPKGDWFTVRVKPGKTAQQRVKSPALPEREKREDAEADLKAYAEKHGLNPWVCIVCGKPTRRGHYICSEECAKAQAEAK